MKDECSICGANAETRHIPIYTNGSEGINPCHSCEMAITNFIRGMQSAANRSKLAYVKRVRNIKINK